MIPIEAKASNSQTISLNEHINEYKPDIAYKLIDGNIGIEGRKVTMP